MCNRFRMTEGQIALAARYGVEAPFTPDHTIPPPELFPDKPAYVVRQEGGARTLDIMRWGFPRKVPGKRIDKVTGKPVLLDTKVTNVRNLESPMWRNVLSKPAQRCLIPVTSFSEYGPGEKGNLPLYWFDVPSRPFFSFAGIWRPAAEGAVFAFLTCEPNSAVAPIHPKAMPLILHEDDEERWLAGELVGLVAPFPAQLMTVSPAEYAKPSNTLI